MANPQFPVIPYGPDSKFYAIDYEDVTMRNPLDGGYVSTRARHTRTPRKTWTAGYTEMHDSDKLILEAFWLAMKGGTLLFDWANPEDGVTYTVRFFGKLNFKYSGLGATKLWTAQIQFEQV